MTKQRDGKEEVRRELQTFFAGLGHRIDWFRLLDHLGIDVVRTDGDEIIARCPDHAGLHAHGDSNPSWAFNTKEYVYNCFVCGGGSIFTLLKEVLSLDRDRAKEWLIEQAGAPVERTEDFVEEINQILAAHEPEEKEPLPHWPDHLLFQYRGIHDYLYERGLATDVIQEKQIGWDNEHCGIVIPHWFRGRLVGIQFRHLAQRKDGTYLCPTCTEKKIPKYKNTPRFPRAETLYNYDLACGEGASVIVVESPFSVLFLMSHGVRNVVATFGAGLSSEQLNLLSVFHEGVYIWPDNDPAGYSEKVKNSVKLLGEYVPLFMIPCVDKEKGDVGDLKDTPEQIQQYLHASYPAVEFLTFGPRIGIGDRYEVNR